MRKHVAPTCALLALLSAMTLVGACSAASTDAPGTSTAPAAPVTTPPDLPSGWQTVSDPSFGFTVAHPKSWKVISPNAPSVAGNPAFLTGFGAPSEPGSPFKANVSVLGQMIPPAGAELTLANVAEQANQVISSAYPGLVAAPPASASLGGIPAIQIEYTGVEHGVNLTITQLMALHDDRLILLTTSAQANDVPDLVATFDTIIDSFRFTD